MSILKSVLVILHNVAYHFFSTVLLRLLCTYLHTVKYGQFFIFLCWYLKDVKSVLHTMLYVEALWAQL